MKTSMNITTALDDVNRYASREDLISFYRKYGCSGLEVMPLSYEWDGDPLRCPLFMPDMVNGVHCVCVGDWMDQELDGLIEHYRQDLRYATQMQAEYVVFHATQVCNMEGYTHKHVHTDEEVIDFLCDFVNRLLDGQNYSFYFLLENLWWSGLTFLRPEISRRLLDGIHYPKKGFMLDTGHFLHTNLDLETQAEAVQYLHSMLDVHADLLPYFKGIHLQQSLTGAYVKEWIAHPPVLPEDPNECSALIWNHIFQIDRHEPFTDPGVRALVERIDPLYVTYEYITTDRTQHAAYLEAGSRALMY